MWMKSVLCILMLSFPFARTSAQVDAEQVMKAIDRCEGVLPFNDKASPEIIKREFSMSKTR